MLTRFNRILRLCALAALIGSCAGRSATARGPLGPVKPASLEDYIRATYKVGVENAAAQKESAPQQDPIVADLLSRTKASSDDQFLKAQLADLYYQRELYLPAYDVLMELHSRYPEDQETNLKLAHIWDAWEQHGLALQHASRALDAGIDSAEAYALMARIQLHLNKPDAAIPWYLKSLEKDGRNASVLANLGYAHILRSEWQPAQQYLEEALALNDSMHEAHNNLAGVLAEIGDYDGSLRHLMQAGTPAVAMNNMGVLYLQQEKTVEALRYFREALRLDPSYTTAERNLQLTQRLTPPAAIMQLPSFDKIPANEGANALITPLPAGPIPGPALAPRVEAPRRASLLPLAPEVTSDELDTSPTFSQEFLPTETTETANNGTAVDASSVSPSEARHGEFRKSSGSPVWPALQHKRVRLAGFAGLILLTGLLAFRARKLWD